MIHSIEKLNLIKKNINIGIFRMILCFWVVINHTCIFKNSKIINSQFHVPSFMIISFYFFYKNLFKRNIQKIKSRFERLLLPYLIWPIILLIINNLLLLFQYESFFEKKLTLYDLILSFIFGRHINHIFWFQFDLLFVTLIFTIFSFIFKNKLLIIVNYLLIFSYFMQYSGINYKYFNKYKDLNHRNIGSIIEMIPFNVTGILLSYLNIINKIKKKKIYVICSCILMLFCLLKYKIFQNIPGFRYPGINLNLGGISLFILFSLIPFEKVKNPLFLKFILFITNYTGGIYYLHWIFLNYLKKKLYGLDKKLLKELLLSIY